ncbi:MAG: hypothetical protein WEB58_11795 [Planctomycetaceae bacterium]
MEMFDWELWQKSQWNWALLILIITAGAAVILKIRTWMAESDDPAASAQQMLMQMKDLKHEGVLTDAEFRKINSRFTGRPDDAPTLTPPPSASEGNSSREGPSPSR